VLDEADKLFELSSGNQSSEQNENSDGAVNGRSSFLSQVDEILGECSLRGKGLQCALFSATTGPHVQELASTLLRSDFVSVTVGTENAGASTISQDLKFVGNEEGKLIAIRQLVQEGRLKPPTLIFVQNVDRAKELYRELVYDGISVEVMHSDRTQLQREEIITRFRTGQIWILICTDLMARGVDFVGVKLVINYDLPTSAVSYIHRIGRTGRAGRKGEAITLFTEADMAHLRSIANVMKLSGCDVPAWVLTIKQVSMHYHPFPILILTFFVGL
jgi:ATP-dependent RNA helicase DDX52/ROK1